ncbi:hypothetical protein IEO21_08991 [Rhodonia placenta]|uniref:Uncharacterized protein n=1 Tax=Rhodonia placenta TaxID=104341 RepID=A0A8H7TYA6_9APHY|nr:hypothetical protein IEO21_08991 [Postia placenta]
MGAPNSCARAVRGAVRPRLGWLEIARVLNHAPALLQSHARETAELLAALQRKRASRTWTSCGSSVCRLRSTTRSCAGSTLRTRTACCCCATCWRCLHCWRLSGCCASGSWT